MVSVHDLKPDDAKVAELDNARIWEQAMGAAAKAFSAGDSQTGVAKLVYASWLAATHGLVMNRATATAACSRVNDAAGTFKPPGEAA